MTSFHQSLVEAWAERVARTPDAVAVAYFDGRLTVREVDEASDALGAAFTSLGTQRGDRVGLYLQNIPQYALALLALWKLGATALVLNPMYRGRELRRLMDDSGAIGFVCTDADLDETRETWRAAPFVGTSALHRWTTKRATMPGCSLRLNGAPALLTAT